MPVTGIAFFSPLTLDFIYVFHYVTSEIFLCVTDPRTPMNTHTATSQSRTIVISLPSSAKLAAHYTLSCCLDFFPIGQTLQGETILHIALRCHPHLFNLTLYAAWRTLPVNPSSHLL
jgi:hypothetical protein